MEPSANDRFCRCRTGIRRNGADTERIASEEPGAHRSLLKKIPEGLCSGDKNWSKSANVVDHLRSVLVFIQQFNRTHKLRQSLFACGFLANEEDLDPRHFPHQFFSAQPTTLFGKRRAQDNNFSVGTLGNLSRFGSCKGRVRGPSALGKARTQALCVRVVGKSDHNRRARMT